MVKALVDTGSNQTVVKASLISYMRPSYEKVVHIPCIHGDSQDYPTANVNLEIEG